ncbi:hypothetical protein Q7P37_008993 [Cladosporium fusiforme]
MEGLSPQAAADSAKPSGPLSERTNNATSTTTAAAGDFYKYTTRVEDGYNTETSKTLRPTGPISWASPMPEVEKCWSDIVTWRDSSIKWWNKYIAETPFPKSAMTEQTTILRVTETSWETTIYPTSVSDYTLCDGTPRVDARPETRTTTYNVTHSNVQTVPKDYAFPQTQPCMPDPKTCRLWYYDSNINVTNEAELLQLCGKPTGLYEPCLVRGGPVQLIYWPEESGDDHVCPNNASSPLRQPAHSLNQSVSIMAETVTALGTTFTSGSVYLSFHTLYASYDGFYDRVGPTFKDTIIPVPSSAMSTHCGGLTDAHGPGTALTYADLNWPVPASAYNCQARCDQAFVVLTNRSSTPPECKTIWSDVNPNIAIPTMVKDLVPEWSSCEMSGFRIPNFWFDPPVMLTKTDKIAMPSTFHAEPTKEPPAPSMRLTGSVPKETGSSQGPAGGDDVTSSRVAPSKVHEEDDVPQPTLTNADISKLPIQESASHPAEPETLVQSETHMVELEEGPTSQTTAESDSTEDPSNPWALTTQFSYQPISASLDALSILESALGELSKSGIRPSVQYTGNHQGNEGVPEEGTQDVTKPATSGFAESTGNVEEQEPPLPVVTTTSAGLTRSVPVATDRPSSEPRADTTSNHAAYTPPTSDANQISYVTDKPMPPVVTAPQDSSKIHLDTSSLFTTGSTISKSSGSISLGGTALSEGGDAVTLSSGESLMLEPSGIEVVGENSTGSQGSSTMDGATFPTDETPPTPSIPGESSAVGEQAEGAGNRICGHSLAVVLMVALLTLF